MVRTVTFPLLKENPPGSTTIYSGMEQMGSKWDDTDRSSAP